MGPTTTTGAADTAGLGAVATAYGRPALEALARLVAAGKAGRPLDPVTVLVPTNYAGVSARRWLARTAPSPMPGGVGLAAVSFLTVHRLAELVAGPVLARSGRRPVSSAVIGAAVREVLVRAPGLFSPVSEHPTTEAELVRAHRELRPLTASELDRLAGASPRAAEVVRIHRAVHRALRTRFYDEHDLMEAATPLLAGSGALPAEAAAAAVVVYLPQDLPRPAAELLGALARRTAVTVVAGYCGVPAADATVVRSLDRLGLRSAAPAGVTAPPVAQVVSMSDADDEVRWVTRALVDALGRGVPLDRMAVLYSSHDPYARLLDEHLGAAGLERNGSMVGRLADSLFGRATIGLLHLTDRDLARDDVMEWLTGAPVVGEGGRPVPSSAWERVSRRAGVVAGGDWDDRLGGLAWTLEESIGLAEAKDDDEARLRGLRNDAMRARELRDFVMRLRHDLAHGLSAGSWAAMARWLQRCLRTYLGPDSWRSAWPEAEQVAAERVMGALERLSSLDDIEPSVDLSRFRRALRAELDASLGRVGRLGQGVLTGRPTVALGVELDLVVVLGMAEGDTPAAPSEDSLLPDVERRTTGGALRLRASQPLDDQRAFLAAVAGAREVVLTWPRGDLRRAASRLRSRWVPDVSLGSNRGAAAADRPRDEHIEVPSYLAGLAQAAFPATDQEHRLASLLHDDGAAAAIAAADPVFAAGRELVHARASDRFTRFDGNLGALAGRPDPSGRVLSASRLQAWAACPFAYLLEYELGVGLIENPEQILEVSPLDRGTMVHQVLERWVSGTGAPTIEETADEVFEPFIRQGRVGRSVFWQHARAEMRRDLRRFQVEDEAQRARGFEAVASEHRFGFDDGGSPTVSMVLPSGRAVQFRGSVDRIDRGPGGLLAVVDYKTGSTTGYGRLATDDPVDGGLRLQLPIYALAARALDGQPETPVRADYWFVTDKGGFQRIGYELDEPRLDRFVSVLEVILAGLGAGIYPLRPPEVAWPRRGQPSLADPDGLGTRDLQRSWERKRHAAELAPFVALRDGDDTLEEDDTEATSGGGDG